MEPAENAGSEKGSTEAGGIPVFDALAAGVKTNGCERSDGANGKEKAGIGATPGGKEKAPKSNGA